MLDPVRGAQKGKAPPIDQFTGEDEDTRLDDWLPALARVAYWNHWSPEECLMRLAGHLRGRALQELGLLEDSEKMNWDMAVAALCACLDPGNKQLAAQEL